MKPAAKIALAALGLWIFCAIAAPWIAPYPLSQVDLLADLQPPSSSHWLGTDENGQDVLTLCLYGARVALIVGLGTVSICAVLGTLLGSLSGYFGGIIDEILMRAIDILCAFPGILLAILLIALRGEPSVATVIFALSVTGWAGYARLARAQVLSLRTRPFVLAARSMGASTWRILTRHLIPNLLGPVIVQATFGIASAILSEASLSFLGLGPDVPSWGVLLDQGARYFLISGHLALFPGLAILFAFITIHTLGQALRDRFAPSSKGK